MIRIAYNEIVEVLSSILENRGFTSSRARMSAELFTDANRDGVYSHGLDRFGRFLRYLSAGLVIPDAEPERVWSGGALERWDGHSGPGSLNAHAAMARACELAEANGIGCVALANTNHWMRGGAYGWQAADAGYLGICWTNTMPNLPPWGSDKPLIGNNPLIIAVPRPDGHVVLDMAMSQFSYGALSRYAKEGRELPVPGGYDKNDRLTTDAAAVESTGRPLPIGFWKGSGLSILLDLLAALLSGGRAVCDMPADPDKETGVSQVFIAFSPPDHPGLTDRVVASLEAEGKARYPGKGALAHREESRIHGVAVDEEVWKDIKALLKD
ncbi:MAG: 3-dehydro-L-gulonate 2-dehydrogenase [Spirochaetaceae bacterium]|nr:3-dehydro-L-gulonate 2-dehydrogenase [Spirochaetaceae bacterium]MDT8297665.1 3-dehydro-L-gulonate 2-dehydrogenase [Spirochaetaceae bacterium]